MMYTIIGGVNGVGKSSIYSGLSDASICALGKRINVDEIVCALGDWRDTRVQFQAGKQAVKEIKACLNAGVDFHQESTLAGQTILHTVKKAKAPGYTVRLWYIFVADVRIAKERVRVRVENGGHGVPDAVIERRSAASLTTLKALAPLCDEVWLYDNTVAYTLVAKILNGRVSVLDRKIPANVRACFS